jgi:aminopeptidase N
VCRVSQENVLSEAVKAYGVAVDPTAVHEAREQLKNTIASVSVDALQQVYRAHRTDYAQPFELTTRAVGARQLCALALQYLCATDEAGATAAICAARDTLLFSFSPRGFPTSKFSVNAKRSSDHQVRLSTRTQHRQK